MHGLAMAVALALRSDLRDLAVFAAIAPLGLLGSLVSGTIAERMQRARAGLEAQQSAIRAQELEARASEIGHLQERLFEILQSQHDARNALSTALLDAHDLLDLARAPREPECRRLRDSATVLQATLARVARAVEDVRDLAEAERRRRGGDARPVPVWPLARRVAEALGRRFPGVRIECRAESAYAERAEASVSGGAESLNRMLENAVANACEGDGGARSRRVEVLVLGRPDTGSLGVEVRDDGPGFPSELLAGPIAAFRTTKPGGSGLGLYTTERLVHASGGWLRRANRADGGAVLSMFLPEALAARSAAPAVERA
jgi:signal transduction histidine kinase